MVYILYIDLYYSILIKICICFSSKDPPKKRYRHISIVPAALLCDSFRSAPRSFRNWGHFSQPYCQRHWGRWYQCSLSQTRRNSQKEKGNSRLDNLSERVPFLNVLPTGRSSQWFQEAVKSMVILFVAYCEASNKGFILEIALRYPKVVNRQPLPSADHWTIVKPKALQSMLLARSPLRWRAITAFESCHGGFRTNRRHWAVYLRQIWKKSLVIYVVFLWKPRALGKIMPFLAQDSLHSPWCPSNM